MNLHTLSTRTRLHRTLQAAGIALALTLAGCGGGGGDAEPTVQPPGPIGGNVTPLITAAPADRQMIVGQRSSFVLEAQGVALSFGWEEQPAGSTDWRAATGTITSDGSGSSMIVGPVEIGMHQSRFRGSVSNTAGTVTTDPARLDVVWGVVSTVEPNPFDFGPGAGGFGSADGGTPGGGDGEGAGVGGGLGKTLRTPITIARVADGAALGSASTGASSGVVRVKAGPGAAPVVITMRGGAGATFYDEGRDAMLPLAENEELHALALSFDRHLGVTTLTEAAYRYALNHFLQDPDAVRAGVVPLKRTATAAELARLTPLQIQLANEAVRLEINRLLPARYALDSISTLPTPVDNTSPAGSITDNIYGRMQAVVGGLALAAARFESSLDNPALRMNAQLADDLTDGVVDGLSLDQRSVFGPDGTNAYGPDSLPQLLADAADAQFERFGDGTVTQPPVITGQPSAAVITEGGSATLSVAARGSLLNFQWFRDGSPISGATRPELTTTVSGEYRVDVSNAAQTVSSNSVTVTVVPAPVAPTITTQPASTSVTSGDVATFTVQATGTDLRFQWQLVSGGSATDIPGATANSYGTSTAGTYRVIITNSVGTATSQDVTLTVTERVIAPRITRQPTAQTIVSGQVATLQVEASGNPLAFQWHDANGPIANATSARYQTSRAGTYHVVVSNTQGFEQSVSVTVTVISLPVITTQPASTTIAAGQTATLTVVAGGIGLSYEWLRDGVPVDGGNQASLATSTAGIYTVSITNAAGTVTSAPATVTVITAPVITTQPASATIDEGRDHTFTVAASGSELRYQWHAVGEATTPIEGATSASFTTRAAGRYLVEVANRAGTVRSDIVTLTVTPEVVAPRITTHPQSVTINQGETTTLSVVATGSSLEYQWRLNGNDVPGATGANHTTGTAGSYTVVVRNSRESVTSNAATVTVITYPVITQQPTSRTIVEGQTATFSVVATGPNLAYQWEREVAGVPNTFAPIGGANGTSYGTGTAGRYRVMVSNSARAVPSEVVTLTVTPAAVPVTITSSPQSISIPAGTTTTLSVVASGTAPLTYQWFFDGREIANSNAPTYVTGTAGDYHVRVSNSVNGINSAVARVTVVPLPTITRQPASATLPEGSRTTFTVEATGAARYQWHYGVPGNSSPIANATGASWTTATRGSYFAMVFNSLDRSVNSNVATLATLGLPEIVTQPRSVTVPPGGTGTFFVEVRDPFPERLRYQWYQRFAGGGTEPMGGQTTAQFRTNYPGTYFVVVTNDTGSTTSANATLTIDDSNSGYDCSIPLPTPKVSRGPTVEGRIGLPVDNFESFDDALFEAAPDLPACGLNTSSSRSWVNILDGKTRTRLCGFCALGNASSLQGIWISQSSLIGSSVYVEIVDRACKDRSVLSNLVAVQ